MSILFEEEQMAIAEESRRVLDARTNLAQQLELLEKTGEHDETFWQTAIEQGWTALAFAEEHGGIDLGLVELGIVSQAIGAGTAGAPFLTTCFGAACAISASGNKAMETEWFPKLASGEAIGVVAFAEHNSPLPKVPTSSFAAGKLSGAKDAVVGGLAADFAVVWAMGEAGPVLVLAELNNATRASVESFDNSRVHADLAFAEVPATLLAKGEDAPRIALEVLARMAVVTAFEQVGGAQKLLETARDYANTRRAFGQTIGSFQSVKHRIAELYALVEVARANAIHAAASDGTGEFLKAAAAARISATEAYDTAARDCVQIHGGIGVTWELGLHLHMRRARSLAIEQGNLLYWEDVLVEQLTGVEA